MPSAFVSLFALIFPLAASLAAETHPSLPPPVVPECFGVNIHFTDPKPGEFEMLAAAGFKWVRMDLAWAATERAKGEYDFSAYDRLVAALDKHKLRALFILDYGNPLYAEPDDKHPFTSRAGTAEFRVIHYPIEWDSIFLLDNVSREAVEGEVFLSAPTLIY
jgi:hypothetical protein